MTKKLFTIFTFILIIASITLGQAKETPRSGGFARVQAMGLNPYIVDPYYMTVNPAWASVYYDFLWGDLGSTKAAFVNDAGNGEFAGFNFQLSEELVLGAMLTRNDFNNQFSIGSLNAANALITQINNIIPAGTQVVPLNNNMEVLAAFKLGKLSIGLGASYAGSTNQNNPSTGGSTEASASQIGVNAGIVTLTNLVKLDASAAILMPSASFTAPNTKETKVSQTFIQAQARVFYKLSTKFSLVPSATFVTSSGTADAAGTSSDLPSTMILIAGLGLSYEVGDVLVAGGPAFIYTSTTTKVKDAADQTDATTMFPVWNVGVEWNIAEWLVGRFGYIAQTQKETNQTLVPADPKKINETVITSYLVSQAVVGLGFKIGRLSLDGTVNVDVLRQGLANLGNANAGATFGYLSISFGF
jgi:hypothetical protein